MGITTVLTISTVIQGLKSQLPAVNYLTALDVYLWACFFFVSVTLIEYAYLNYQTVVLPADKEYRRRNGAEGERMRALTLAAGMKNTQEDSGQGRGISQARGSTTFDSKNLHGRHLDGKNYDGTYPTVYEKPNSYENQNFDTTEFDPTTGLPATRKKTPPTVMPALRKSQSVISYKFKSLVQKNMGTPDSECVENQSSPQYRTLVKKVIVWNRKQKNYSRTLEIDRYRWGER